MTEKRGGTANDAKCEKMSRENVGVGGRPDTQVYQKEAHIV